ncbi:MFS transporter [Streptomyces violaceus]|uniref:MFS transporter n=1 Tax=Streptomyces violaceus TaxID=1936 RepID=A0ABY9UMD4_STRVL|nr:MFS transporter [Streptomyces janthinus]WND23494.1 MFS transporter [Streptomyces janthinus]GGS91526.1 MFS transporter [Streptomyces janthinus]
MSYPTSHTSQEAPRGDARFSGVGGRAWLAIALGVAAVGWGANQFAPLLLMYRSELGVPTTTVEATYALYAVGLIPGLLLGGPSSDRYGRRRVLVPALVISALASGLLMLAGSGIGWLFVGRLVAGAASGAAFSTGTAWIKELTVSGSGQDEHTGARRATIGMTMGFAVGPLVAGLLAQAAPDPVVSSYVPHVVLTLAAVPFVLHTPETHAANGDAPLWSRLRLAEESSRRFWTVVVPLAPWVFGASAIALAYLPGLVLDRLGDNALMFSAVVTMLTMVAGIVVQPLARRVSHPDKPYLIATALGIVVGGLVLGAVAAADAHWWIVAVAALVLGAGYGCCLVCGLMEVQRMASTENLGRLTAIFQAFAYLGFGAPYLLALIEHVLPPSELLLLAAALAALTLAWTTYRASHGPDPAKQRTKAASRSVVRGS